MLQWNTSVLNAARRAVAAANDVEATMQAERDLMKRWLQWRQCQHHTTMTIASAILSDPGIDTSHHTQRQPGSWSAPVNRHWTREQTLHITPNVSTGADDVASLAEDLTR
jgi:hypothetical protein